MNEARIAALNLYPVKGCAGIALTEATIATTGLVASGAGDREWMIVDPEGNLVTQREFPRMALVGVTTSNDTLWLSDRQGKSGVAPLAIPMVRERSAAIPVRVWNSHVRGHDEGDVAAAWLTQYLGAEVRLVRFDREMPRNCNPEFAGDSGAHTMYADGYPLLIISQASLDELNGRLANRGAAPLPMNRFRPNIVLEGLDAFAEDHVDTIDTGGVTLRVVKPCVRCQVTTTDQDSTAAVGIEPLQTLGEFRMDERMGGVTFGMNAIVIAGAGRSLSRGMSTRIEYNF